jgi:hypothetical protein
MLKQRSPGSVQSAASVTLCATRRQPADHVSPIAAGLDGAITLVKMQATLSWASASRRPAAQTSRASASARRDPASCLLKAHCTHAIVGPLQRSNEHECKPSAREKLGRQRAAPPLLWVARTRRSRSHCTHTCSSSGSSSSSSGCSGEPDGSSSSRSSGTASLTRRQLGAMATAALPAAVGAPALAAAAAPAPATTQRMRDVKVSQLQLGMSVGICMP